MRSSVLSETIGGWYWHMQCGGVGLMGWDDDCVCFILCDFEGVVKWDIGDVSLLEK